MKKTAIITLAILVLIIVLGLLIPRSMHVETNYQFEAPPNYVFNILNDTRNTTEWNSWMMEQEDLTIERGNIFAGEGASYTWDSPSLGKGTVLYKKVILNERIETIITIDEDKESSVIYSFSPNEKGTEMQIMYDTKISFPFNIIKWWYKFRINKVNKRSLKKIDLMATNHVKGIYNGFMVKEASMPEKNYVMNRDEIAINDIQKFYTQNLGAIFLKLQKEEVKMDGMPSGLFFKYDNSKGMTDMAAAIPVNEATDIMGLASYTIPAGDALVIDYYGDYSQTMTGHDAMEKYMKDRNILYNPPVVEEYVTDPEMEKDPSKWLTKIIYYFSPTK